MTEQKHSPAPWRVVPTTAKSAGTHRRDVLSDGGPYAGAYVAGDILDVDARLIAAAPALLDALRALVDSPELADHVTPEIDAALEAIRLATEGTGNE